MAAMEPMADTDAAHAAHAAPIAHAADVTSAESKTTVASAEAATHTPTMTAAASTPHTDRYKQTAPRIIGVLGIARILERCRGSKSKRKNSDNPKRDDVAIHDYTTYGDCMTRSLHRAKQ
jgi:hypothetical protein